ncbi:MAG: glycosyltransferase [Candidatus Omnitrophica bacterium]|nr:glycosyltransferase [Candidatus Omnitrophota bacterium]
MDALSLSVIIPAYNAADTIGDALSALEKQTCRQPFEIVVVDDGSTDATRQVVSAHPGVKYIFQANAGPASARNCGARKSSGQILLFTDADCCPEREWLEKMLRGFEADNVAVVSGGYGIANPESWLARVIHYEIKFRHRCLMPEFPRAFGSYNFAIRRDVFELVGGFNAQYRRASGEDNDLSYKVIRNGWRIRFLKDALVDHYHQADLGRYLKEQFRHGIWRARIYVDHPGMAAGDDYTFWKDIAEVPAVIVSLVLFVCMLPLYAIAFLAAIFMLEEGFGLRMMPSLPEGLTAGAVFLVRAYARAAGFLTGAGKFVIYIFMRKKI